MPIPQDHLRYLYVKNVLYVEATKSASYMKPHVEPTTMTDMCLSHIPTNIYEWRHVRPIESTDSTSHSRHYMAYYHKNGRHFPDNLEFVSFYELFCFKL